MSQQSMAPWPFVGASIGPTSTAVARRWMPGWDWRRSTLRAFARWSLAWAWTAAIAKPRRTWNAWRRLICRTKPSARSSNGRARSILTYVGLSVNSRRCITIERSICHGKPRVSGQNCSHCGSSINGLCNRRSPKTIGWNLRVHYRFFTVGKPPTR